MNKNKKIKDYIINFLPKAKTFKTTTTYGYKHMCERYIKEYVSNDEMLKAFIELGYEVKQSKYNSKNYHVKCNLIF